MSEPNCQLYVDSKFTSPYALVVFVTLTEKGLPFDRHPIDKHQWQRSSVQAWVKRDRTQVG
jgi:glutathione S-transferase